MLQVHNEVMKEAGKQAALPALRRCRERHGCESSSGEL